MKIVISGIQPTGNLHLGNYLGSLKKWSNLQEEYDCIFPIVDLHAISGETIKNTDLYNNILLTCSAYIASGVNPEKVVMFQQSDVSYHSELLWLLSNVTSIGKLNRMTQFKDKGKNKPSASLGLFSYPVLMAADILLYKADLVPVGDDQLQHIELTNDIAASFNARYEVDFFHNVESLLSDRAKRVMSLRNGNEKMSKSAKSDMSRINLTDSNDEIIQKIKKAKTDTIDDLVKSLDERPEVKNLLNIYAVCSNISFDDCLEDVKSKNFKQFKIDLADKIIDVVEPFREKMFELVADRTYIEHCLQSGSNKALELADRNFSEIKKIVGLKN